LSEVAYSGGDGGGLWPVSFTKLIPGILVDFGVVFLHENKSRKTPKNMPGVVIDVIVAHNHCLWVPITLGPVSVPQRRLEGGGLRPPATGICDPRDGGQGVASA
jgi:hypothetical protein